MFLRSGSSSLPQEETPQQQQGRKRTRQEGAPEADLTLASTNGGAQDDTAPAAKRTKRDSGKRELVPEPSPKQPRAKRLKPQRGKAAAKPVRVEADGQVQRSAQEARQQANPEAEPTPKRRGRPSKKSRPASAPDTTVQKAVTPGRKRRGRPPKAAPLPAQGARASAQGKGKQKVEKNAATAKKTKETTTAPPVTGLRRSGRIAARR